MSFAGAIKEEGRLEASETDSLLKSGQRVGETWLVTKLEATQASNKLVPAALPSS